MVRNFAGECIQIRCRLHVLPEIFTAKNLPVKKKLFKPSLISTAFLLKTAFILLKSEPAEPAITYNNVTLQHRNNIYFLTRNPGPLC